MRTLTRGGRFQITPDDCEVVDVEGIGKVEGFPEVTTIYKFTFKVNSTTCWKFYAPRMPGNRVAYLAYADGNENSRGFKIDGEYYYTGINYIYVDGEGVKEAENGSEFNDEDAGFDGDLDWYFYNLDSDLTYCIYFTDLQLNNTEDMTKRYPNGFSAPGQWYANSIGFWNKTLEDSLNAEETTFQKIEHFLSDFVRSVANLLEYIVAAALHQTLTIDNIVFDEYDEVKLNFFSTDINGAPVESSSGIVNALKGVVNEWYSFFRAIALVGYMIILVYIGIKIILDSTTADKKATYKNTFMYWATGIVILFFFPYVMKYTMILNSAMATQIGSTRTQHALEAGDKATQFQTKDGYLIEDFDSTFLLTMDGTDYMSVIRNMAWMTKSLGISIAYAVLAWQLVMMIVYYYKRVFVTGFLIVIFPLVALTYVWDKLNDGKSQALSAWTHEFMIDVFIQTFHAIVYVFVTNTIYATLGQYTADFILLIIASSFMFAGENILKQIFGGGGVVATQSVAQTGARLVAATAIVGSAGKRIIHNTVGKDGFVRKTIASGGELRKYNLLLKKTDDGRRVFDVVASDSKRQSGIYALLPKDGNIEPDIRKAAETVDTLNNAATRDPKEVAAAMREYRRLMNERKNMDPNTAKQLDAIMGRCTLSNEQLDAIEKGMVASAVMAPNTKGAGATKKISQRLRLSVDYAFPDQSTPEGKKLADTFYQAALINLKDYGASRGITRGKLENDFQNKLNEMQDLKDRIGFAPMETKTERDERKADARRAAKGYKATAGTYTRSKTSSSYDARMARESRKKDLIENRAEGIRQQYEKRYGAIEASKRNEFMQYARQTAIAENLDKKDFTVHEAYLATHKLSDGSEFANRMLEISNIDTDIDTFRYTVLQAISEETQVTDKSLTPSSKRLLEETRKEARKDLNKIYKQSDERTRIIADGNLDSSNNVEADVTVFDVIAAGKAASSSGDIENMDQLLADARAKHADILNQIRDLARAQNQKEILYAKDFAEKAFSRTKIDGKVKDFINDTGYIDQPTYNGYTFDEIKKLRSQAMNDTATNAASFMSDFVLTAPATVIGAAIGSAMSDDGLPIEEGFIGGASGFGVANKVSDSMIPKMTGNRAYAERSSEIKQRVKERADHDKKERLKARQAFANVAEAKKDKADSYLTLNGATANLTSREINGEITLYATLHIMAENAEYISISETPGIPSSGWEPFQEIMNYTFSDNDVTKERKLYICVRDGSNNIKSAVLTGLRFNP